jgi:hypothetical protein
MSIPKLNCKLQTSYGQYCILSILDYKRLIPEKRKSQAKIWVDEETLSQIKKAVDAWKVKGVWRHISTDKVDLREGGTFLGMKVDINIKLTKGFGVDVSW